MCHSMHTLFHIYALRWNSRLTKQRNDCCKSWIINGNDYRLTWVAQHKTYLSEICILERGFQRKVLIVLQQTWDCFVKCAKCKLYFPMGEVIKGTLKILTLILAFILIPVLSQQINNNDWGNDLINPLNGKIFITSAFEVILILWISQNSIE